MNNKLGLALIAFLIAVKFVVIPWTEWLSEAKDELTQKKMSSARLEQLDERIELAKENINSYEQKVALLDKTAFSGSRSQVTSEAFGYIQDLATLSGAKVRNMRIGELQEGELVFYPVEFLVEGAPYSVGLFLSKLESRERQLSVSQAIVRKDRRKDNIVINMTIYIVMSQGNMK